MPLKRGSFSSQAFASGALSVAQLPSSGCTSCDRWAARADTAQEPGDLPGALTWQTYFKDRTGFDVERCKRPCRSAVPVIGAHRGRPAPFPQPPSLA
jgi:hypothetical protein